MLELLVFDFAQFADHTQCYADLDPRVRPLVFAVKRWASRRCIKEPKNGGLSSYSFVLLMIHYLQVASPPVLPCLQSPAYVRAQNGGVPGVRAIS